MERPVCVWMCVCVQSMSSEHFDAKLEQRLVIPLFVTIVHAPFHLGGKDKFCFFYTR